VFFVGEDTTKLDIRDEQDATVLDFLRHRLDGIPHERTNGFHDLELIFSQEANIFEEGLDCLGRYGTMLWRARRSRNLRQRERRSFCDA
jgi:hypothetical protein